MNTPPITAQHPAPVSVALSLVSHTNVGKTTLARTLLGQDVGEVRDQAHVTEHAEPHRLLSSPAGDQLLLWDTPGFGNSQRLARRLAQAGNPLGWFLSEVWDRFRDRPFWSAQRALRHVLAESDLVLYLVNAAEAPEDVPYLDAELQVLALVGKPVVVLLNQLGPPRPAAEEEAELQRWQQRCRSAEGVKAVLALDAFARCWVQEGRLLDTVAPLLPAAHQAGFARLQASWQQQQQQRWTEAMALLAGQLTLAASDQEPLPESGWGERLRALGSALGQTPSPDGPQQRAMQTLAQRLDQQLLQHTNRLIALHGLRGASAQQALQRVATHFAVTQPLPEGKAALLGGLLAGAVTGLKADLASGGLTLGGGMLAGGLLGALGALGVTRGLNQVQGRDQASLRWRDAVLHELLVALLLGYLAVLHFGRGRGDWQDGEHPAFWRPLVAEVLAAQAADWQALWARRPDLPMPADSETATSQAFRAQAQQLLAQASRELLRRLYPAASDHLPAHRP